METLTTATWLAEHLDDPDLVILDCTGTARWSEKTGQWQTASCHDRWADGHIPGSRYADFTQPGFAGPPERFRNALPEPQDFADAMSRLGVHDGARVVLYDDARSSWAARVWWMLRWIGFDTATILDGGWQQWVAVGGRIARGDASQASARSEHVLSLQLRADLFVDRAGVAGRRRDTALIDALSATQFSGERAELGLKGHIPGAINIPASMMVDPRNGRMLPDAELAGLFPENRAQSVIVYCGSGIAAALVAFAMERSGFSDVSIYMPGLQEWLAEPCPAGDSQ